MYTKNEVSRKPARTTVRGSRRKATGRGTWATPWLTLIVLGFSAGLVHADPAGGAPAGQRMGVTEAAPPGGLLEAALFYSVAITAVVSAIGVCVSRNIVRMATWLFVTLGAVAMIYFLLAASFLGAIQLIIYAGGTLILLVFGVMLTSKSPWVRFEPGKGEMLAATLVCGALLATLCTVLARAVWSPVHEALPGTAVADLGRALISTYVVPFELAGVLLMIVMVGAAHLARQEPS